MSRDMCLMCLGASVSVWGARPAAGLFVLVAPVALGRLDEVDGEDFAGGEVGDRDAGVVGEGEDAFAGVGGAAGEVVHAAGAPQGHAAVLVEAVVAQAVVAWGVSVGGWGGFRGRSVSVARGAAAQRSVRALFVVVLAELVELALQLGKGAGGRPGAEPALQSLVEALDLALGLGVAWGPVLLTDTEERQEVFEGVAPAAEAGGVDAAVVGQCAGRAAVLVDDAEERG